MRRIAPLSGHGKEAAGDRKMTFRFKDLDNGETFDWIGGEHPSFFKRCTKTSARKYRDEDGTIHTVGSIYANVYHLTETQGTGR